MWDYRSNRHTIIDYRSDTTYDTLSIREMWDKKNDQNDQSITCFWGKLSGHYDPKNDQNDYSLCPQKWPKWPVDDLPFREIIWSLWPDKWPKWLLIMANYWFKMTSH